MTKIPEELKAAMNSYAATFRLMNLSVDVIHHRTLVADAKRELEATERMLKDAEQNYQDQLKVKEANIKAQVLELGASASHEGVEAKYRTGYTSETYPVKEVRKILLSNPAILPAFNAISVVKEVEPSVKVSYTAPEGD